MTTKAWIGVGSNLGDRVAQIEEAKKRLSRHVRVGLKRSAPVYETDPVGGPPQGKYLNTVWEVETDLPIRDFFGILSEIEKGMGRVRLAGRRNEPRPIDLDILFFGDSVVDESDLTIPHPRLCARWFVLKPLSDLVPDLTHPVLLKTVSQLLAELTARA